MNIYEKLAKIRSLCEVMQKNRSGFSYKYTSIDEILAKVTAGMKRYKVSLIPKIVAGSVKVEPVSYVKTKATKKGDIYDEKVHEYLVSGDICYRWINDEDPTEFIDVPWFAAGSQSDPSQAHGSSLTYSLRQFLLQYFQIATLDDSDPDNWRSKQKEAETAEDAAVAKEIVDKVHSIVMAHLEAAPDDKDKVSAVVKKYAKDERGRASLNYYLIKDPVAASNLLKEVTEKFASGENNE